MIPSHAHVEYADSETGEFDLIGQLPISTFVEPDFGKPDLTLDHVREAAKTPWAGFELPNGECIEISIQRQRDGHHVLINVRQGTTPIAQLSCETFTSLMFLTKLGAFVSVCAYAAV